MRAIRRGEATVSAIQGVRSRFWLEAGLSAFAASVLLLSIVRKDWIEVVFGVDPDAGSGAVEAVVAVLIVAGVAMAIGAGREWRRATRAMAD
jgi:hypothetical protein